MSGAAEIVFDRVTKRYAGRDGAALNELSLDDPGRHLLRARRALGRRQDDRAQARQPAHPASTRATIRIDGRSVTDLPAVELRRGIGYVIQQAGLFPHMTVADNIATVPRLLGWARARTRARVAELLELVGLEPGDARPLPGRSSRAGSASASGSRARSPPTRRCCSWTSRSARSTRSRAPASRTSCARLHREVAKTVDLRHPRHRRGDQDGRPDRDPARGRRARPVRHAPTRSSPRPADEFVAQFVGEDRALRRLGLRAARRRRARPAPAAATGALRASRRRRPCATPSR